MVFLLVFGAILTFAWRPGYARAGRILCAAVAGFFLILTLLPFGDWVLTPLENRFAFDPPEQVDGIIILGGDEKTEISEARGVPVALDSMRRYREFADLARRYPDAKLIFSGGSGALHPKAHLLDSEVARQIITDMGVPNDRLMIEKTSRNTYENAVFTADIVHPDKAQKYLLVTSAWHMPRAMGCFRKAGWTVYAAPAGYYTTGDYSLHLGFRFDEQMQKLAIAVHEYVGLVAYYLLRQTGELWPG